MISSLFYREYFILYWSTTLGLLRYQDILFRGGQLGGQCIRLQAVIPRRPKHCWLKLEASVLPTIKDIPPRYWEPERYGKVLCGKWDQGRDQIFSLFDGVSESTLTTRKSTLDLLPQAG
jgi:hypothetical protein